MGDAHLQGRRHKEKLEGPKPRFKTPEDLFCKRCEKFLESKEQYVEHVQGAEHKAMPKWSVPADFLCKKCGKQSDGKVVYLEHLKTEEHLNAPKLETRVIDYGEMESQEKVTEEYKEHKSEDVKQEEGKERNGVEIKAEDSVKDEA